MTEFLPSKWGHTLDDKEFTLMLEPYPGTQVIYEHLGNCEATETFVTKVYPPNTTLIVTNPCEHTDFTALGEITKLVVLSNYGDVNLGSVSKSNEVYTKEVVIKDNSNMVTLWNQIDRVEVQENTLLLCIAGTINEHIDVKKMSHGKIYFSNNFY